MFSFPLNLPVSYGQLGETSSLSSVIAGLVHQPTGSPDVFFPSKPAGFLWAIRCCHFLAWLISHSPSRSPREGFPAYSLPRRFRVSEFYIRATSTLRVSDGDDVATPRRVYNIIPHERMYHLPYIG